MYVPTWSPWSALIATKRPCPFAPLWDKMELRTLRPPRRARTLVPFASSRAQRPTTTTPGQPLLVPIVRRPKQCAVQSPPVTCPAAGLAGPDVFPAFEHATPVLSSVLLYPLLSCPWSSMSWMSRIDVSTWGGRVHAPPLRASYCPSQVPSTHINAARLHSSCPGPAACSPTAGQHSEF